MSFKSKSTQEGDIPISDLEITQRVLGKRSGYVQGLGYGSWLKHSSATKFPNEEIERLQQQITKLQEFKTTTTTQLKELKAMIQSFMPQQINTSNQPPPQSGSTSQPPPSPSSWYYFVVCYYLLIIFIVDNIRMVLIQCYLQVWFALMKQMFLCLLIFYRLFYFYIIKCFIYIISLYIWNHSISYRFM